MGPAGSTKIAVDFLDIKSVHYSALNRGLLDDASEMYPYPPSARYKRVVVRSLWYDDNGLAIDARGPRFVFARVVFRRPAGFRVLDERDLCEFWDNYHTANGWFYEVHEGGWQEIEARPKVANFRTNRP